MYMLPLEILFQITQYLNINDQTRLQRVSLELYTNLSARTRIPMTFGAYKESTKVLSDKSKKYLIYKLERDLDDKLMIVDADFDLNLVLDYMFKFRHLKEFKRLISRAKDDYLVDFYDDLKICSFKNEFRREVLYEIFTRNNLKKDFVDECMKIACYASRLDLIKECLELGINIETKNTVFGVVCEKGHLEVVKYLLQDPRIMENQAIRMATENGHLEVVKLLLQDPRVDPSSLDNDAIRMASFSGYSEIVKHLLKDPRVNPRAKENEAIRMASRKGHREVVELLLHDPRVDPSAYKNEAIRKASENGHLDVVKLLLHDPRVDPSAYKNEAIRMASENGHLDVVKLLL